MYIYMVISYLVLALKEPIRIWWRHEHRIYFTLGDNSLDMIWYDHIILIELYWAFGERYGVWFHRGSSHQLRLWLPCSTWGAKVETVVKVDGNEKFSFSKALHGRGSDLGIDLFQQPRIVMIWWKMKGICYSYRFQSEICWGIIVDFFKSKGWFLVSSSRPSFPSSDVSTFTVSHSSNCFSRTATPSSRLATCLGQGTLASRWKEMGLGQQY